MTSAEAYAILVERGYAQSGKIGSAVESMSRVMAASVAMAVKRGAPIEVLTSAMARLDDHGI